MATWSSGALAKEGGTINIHAVLKKHQISFEEAITVFADPEGLHLDDEKHSKKELRFFRIGMSVELRVLIVVFTVRKPQDDKETIRIINARQASKKERQAYFG